MGYDKDGHAPSWTWVATDELRYDMAWCPVCFDGEVDGFHHGVDLCETCNGIGLVPKKCDDCREYMQDGKCLDEECETNS